MKEPLVVKFKPITISIISIIIALLLPNVYSSNKLNVLFIISDDLNMAVGSMGNPQCKTPNIDKLASEGVSFTNAFCNYPICGPSRASIMTGQYPQKNGVVNNGGKVRVDRVTLSKHFMNHGYWSGRVSKIYHMPIPSAIIEGGPGSDHSQSWNMAINVQAMETLTPGKGREIVYPDLETHYPLERAKWKTSLKSNTPYNMPKTLRGDYLVLEAKDGSGLLPDKIATDEAIKILKERSDNPKPFFLAVGLVRPHFPFISPERHLKKYKSKEMLLPKIPENDTEDIPAQAVKRAPHFNDDDLGELKSGYYGAVSYMDEQVGRLLSELDQLKLRENTVVVFVSDHGYLLGEHRQHKKHQLWEEAIHVPLIISAPGKLRNTTCHQMVELVDLYPTLSKLAGLEKDAGSQGLSLVSYLENEEARSLREDAYVYAGVGHALRTKKWAYMWYPKSKKHPEASMLYNMDRDPEQYTNLTKSPEYASIKSKLHARLMKRIEQTEN